MSWAIIPYVETGYHFFSANGERFEKRPVILTAVKAIMAANDYILSIGVVDDHMKRMSVRVSETYRTRLGTFHGLEAGIILHPLGGTEVYPDGAVRCREQLMRDNPGPLAVLNATKRLSSGYSEEIEHLKANIAVKEGQLRD